MSKNYYELLELAPSASPDEIKKAFRREIARYHPDKVHHLGQEFQEIAAAKAAELTEAYRILMDPALRATYDDQIGRREVETEAPPTPAPGVGFARPERARPVEETPIPPSEPPPSAAFQQQRATGDDVVRRAAVAKVREAVASAGEGAKVPARGFDVAYVVRPPRSGLFKKSDPPLRIMTRFVPTVDAAAIQESWSLARRAGVPQGEVPCVFVVGTGLASPSELAGAIAQQRRHDRGAPLVLVPIDVRNWEALMPTDAPAAVRNIIDRLRNLP